MGDCARICATESNAVCNTFSFSPGGGGCIPSHVKADDVDIAADLKVDANWDVYQFQAGDKRCVEKFGGQFSGSGSGSGSCYDPVAPGRRFHPDVATDLLNARDENECSELCKRARGAVCRAFAFRYRLL